MIPTPATMASSHTSWARFSFTPYYIFLIFLLPVLIGCNASEKTEPATTALTEGFTLPPATPISDGEKASLQAACQHWYDSVLRNGPFNGGMLVAKGGNVVFETYKGMEDLRADSINAQTPFHIASVSKTFTAMAVLKLMEAGKLQLTDEFSKYFSEFNYPGVTIETLLNHRSGLPNYLYFMEDLGWSDTVVMKNKDILNYLVTKKAELLNVAPPNTRFNYCNTNYALLALLIEKVSGLSYPNYMEQTFFAPLGLKETFVYTPAVSNRATPNFDWRGQQIANNYLDDIYGDKNIYSTPRNLLTWHRALSSNLLLKPATLMAAYEPYSNERPGIKNYGLGWRMNIYPNGKKVIFHNGWWHGNNVAFVRLID
ncbi:MAG: class A beta-lactamase-related serine hydrolase, partial [Chitinophagaceae bacterium]